MAVLPSPSSWFHQGGRLRAALLRPVRKDEVPAWLAPWMTRRSVWLGSLLMSGLCAGGGWFLYVQHMESVSVRQQMLMLASEHVEQLSPTISAPRELDVTQMLPAYPDVAPVVAELQRSAGSHGVVVQELQSHMTAATQQQLAQAELAVQMRGNYVAIKQVLIEVLGRYPHTTVRRLNLRRDTSPQDLVADIGFTLWGRPVKENP